MATSFFSESPLKTYISNMNPKIHAEFVNFKRDFNKKYGNDYEELRRLKQFEFHYNMIEAHNANPEFTYTLGIN
jgi:hypothetical protein